MIIRGVPESNNAGNVQIPLIHDEDKLNEIVTLVSPQLLDLEPITKSRRLGNLTSATPGNYSRLLKVIFTNQLIRDIFKQDKEKKGNGAPWSYGWLLSAGQLDSTAAESTKDSPSTDFRE